jgi:hypothetical protein
MITAPCTILEESLNNNNNILRFISVGCASSGSNDVCTLAQDNIEAAAKGVVVIATTTASAMGLDFITAEAATVATGTASATTGHPQELLLSPRLVFQLHS